MEPKVYPNPVKPKVWTTGRKIVGNVLPILFAIPFVAVGIWRGSQIQNHLHWSALACYAAAIVAAWLAIGFFGLAGNRAMMLALWRRLAKEGESMGDRWFVGIATPAYRDLWDPHEDIGFLTMAPAALVFEGDSKTIELPKRAVASVRRAPNIHSWLGLGGWVEVHGRLDGKPILLKIEPRDGATLWANKRRLAPLAKLLRDWAGAKDDAPAPKTGAGASNRARLD